MLGGAIRLRTLVLAANAGAYCYPWASRGDIYIMQPERGIQLAPYFEKIILINGMEERFLYDPALQGKDSYFFLWDPARCPHYAPGRFTLERLRLRHKLYSFQREDCQAFGLRFNSTMYALPPPGLLPEAPEILCDVLFLGVPKDRLPLLRALYGALREMGLRACFQIGLTGLEEGVEPEATEGWRITRLWVDYLEYLHWVQQSRALLDLYQAIQTGYSLRVMEHIFFGKKLVTDNAVIKYAEFYHPDNIFLLQEDDMQSLPAWLERPFVPIKDEIKEYYKFENWVKRFV